MKRISLYVMMFLLISACSNANQASNSPTQGLETGENDNQVSLSFAALGGVPDDLQADLKSHFPNFDITFINVKINGLEQYSVDDTFPDIVMDVDHLATPASVWNLVRNDLTDLIDMQGIDLSRFEPGLVERVNSYDDEGIVYELPYSRYMSVLFYNKKAFDAMHIDYPQDGLTWSEVVDIRNKFTNSAYKGFTPFTSDTGFLNLMDQYSLHFLDAKSDQSIVLSSQWHELAQLFRDLTVSRDSKQAASNPAFDRSLFMEDGSIAMALGDGLDLLVGATGHGQDIDLVSYPTIEKGSRIGPFLKTATLYVPSTSKHAGEAFRVVAYLLSEEVQTDNARKGIGPVIRTDDIMNQYSSSVGGTLGKNMKAFFENEFQSPSRSSPYENVAIGIAAPQANSLADPSVNLDEFMKQLDESLNEAVNEAKKKP